MASYRPQWPPSYSSGRSLQTLQLNPYEPIIVFISRCVASSPSPSLPSPLSISAPHSTADFGRWSVSRPRVDHRLGNIMQSLANLLSLEHVRSTHRCLPMAKPNSLVRLSTRTNGLRPSGYLKYLSTSPSFPEPNQPTKTRTLLVSPRPTNQRTILSPL